MATLVMLSIGWHSDHRNERYLHLAAVIGFTASQRRGYGLAERPHCYGQLAYLFFVTAVFSAGMMSAS